MVKVTLPLTDEEKSCSTTANEGDRGRVSPFPEDFADDRRPSFSLPMGEEGTLIGELKGGLSAARVDLLTPLIAPTICGRER